MEPFNLLIDENTSFHLPAHQTLIFMGMTPDELDSNINYYTQRLVLCVKLRALHHQVDQELKHIIINPAG